jgi:invasion protein IalB
MQKSLLLAFFTAFSVMAMGAYAQSPPSRPAAPRQSEPSARTPTQAVPAQVGPSSEQTGAEMTTATFGDWQLRCRLMPVPGKPTQRSCEVIQSIVLQGQTANFAQLGFGRLAPSEPLYFTAVVPVNVAFPSAIKISVDENDKQPVDVVWTRCLSGGCFASVVAKDDFVKRWRQSESGRLTFKIGDGQDFTFAFSFRGLSRALDALAREDSADKH